MSEHITLEDADQKIQQMLDHKKSITILLVGRTGVGKSSTINSLLGAQVAPVGKFSATTMQVTSYQHNHGGLLYNIIDTPGLCDDLPEEGNDHRYLQDIRKAADHTDCLLFVTELDAARISSDERRGIRMITEALGPAAWENSLIVFTRADKVDPRDFEVDLATRSSLVRQAIAAFAPLYAAYIPSLAISNASEHLPNGKPWLGELFTQVLVRLHYDATIPFLHSMKEDIGASESVGTSSHNRQGKGTPGASDQTESTSKTEKPRINLNEEQKQKVKETAWKRVMSGASTGAALGAKIGKPFGKVGEAIGAALGAIGGGLLGWLL